MHQAHAPRRTHLSTKSERRVRQATTSCNRTKQTLPTEAQPRRLLKLLRPRLLHPQALLHRWDHPKRKHNHHTPEDRERNTHATQNQLQDRRKHNLRPRVQEQHQEPSNLLTQPQQPNLLSPSGVRCQSAQERRQLQRCTKLRRRTYNRLYRQLVAVLNRTCQREQFPLQP